MNLYLMIVALVFIFCHGSRSLHTLPSLHLSVGWSEREAVIPEPSGHFHCYKVDEPGRYCEYDLSGYFDCQSDGSEQFILCQNNTRCSCFSGPKCDSALDDPCDEYQHERPLIAHNITSISYGDVHVESTTNTTLAYKFTKQQYQEVDDNGVGRRRADIQNTTWYDANNKRMFVTMQSTYAPTYGNGYYKYIARLEPEDHVCNLTHPENMVPLTDIPNGATYDGTETICEMEAERWKLVTGGARPEEPASVEFFYVGNPIGNGVGNGTIANCTTLGYMCQPIRYFAIFDYSLQTGDLITVNETFVIVKRELIANLKPYAMPPQVCDNSPGGPVV